MTTSEEKSATGPSRNWVLLVAGVLVLLLGILVVQHITESLPEQSVNHKGTETIRDLAGPKR